MSPNQFGKPDKDLTMEETRAEISRLVARKDRAHAEMVRFLDLMRRKFGDDAVRERFPFVEIDPQGNLTVNED